MWFGRLSSKVLSVEAFQRSEDEGRGKSHKTNKQSKKKKKNL